MSTDTMAGTEMLVPKSILDRRKLTIREACFDYAALVDALPSTAPALGEAMISALSDADPRTCRDWLVRVIRALPTTADTEAGHGLA